jgi:hypothetical protein
MNDARIERLTREALGPAKPRSYSKAEDALLRAAGIAVLIVTVVVIASWPRGEEPRRSAKSNPSRMSSIIPASAHATQAQGATQAAEYTPLY